MRLFKSKISKASENIIRDIEEQLEYLNLLPELYIDPIDYATKAGGYLVSLSSCLGLTGQSARIWVDFEDIVIFCARIQKAGLGHSISAITQSNDPGSTVILAANAVAIFREKPHKDFPEGKVTNIAVQLVNKINETAHRMTKEQWDTRL